MFVIMTDGIGNVRYDSSSKAVAIAHIRTAGQIESV